MRSNSYFVLRISVVNTDPMPDHTQYEIRPMRVSEV